jgi:hypothetical protein
MTNTYNNVTHATYLVWAYTINGWVVRMATNKLAKAEAELKATSGRAYVIDTLTGSITKKNY